MTSLARLNAENSPLVDIQALTDITTLTSVYLAACDLHNLQPFAASVGMGTLSVTSCSLQDVSVLSVLHEITVLTLSHNQIRDISVLENHLQASQIRLDDNQIEDILPLTALTYANGGRLSCLWLNDNPLDSTALDTHIPQLCDEAVAVFWGSGQSCGDCL